MLFKMLEQKSKKHIIPLYSVEYKKQPKTSTNIPSEKIDYRYELTKVQDINALEISIFIPRRIVLVTRGCLSKIML